VSRSLPQVSGMLAAPTYPLLPGIPVSVLGHGASPTASTSGCGLRLQRRLTPLVSAGDCSTAGFNAEAHLSRPGGGGCHGARDHRGAAARGGAGARVGARRGGGAGRSLADQVRGAARGFAPPCVLRVDAVCQVSCRQLYDPWSHCSAAFRLDLAAACCALPAPMQQWWCAGTMGRR
jgi:hypothetical protein